MRRKLLISGDIEANPGPDNEPCDDTSPNQIITLLSKLSNGQTEILAEIKSMQEKQRHTDSVLATLKSKIDDIDREISSLKTIKDVAAVSKITATKTFAIAEMTRRFTTLEDHSRQNNLLFFNLPDARGETWKQSEKKNSFLLGGKSWFQDTPPLDRAGAQNWVFQR